jgi:hypothetical protein
MNDEEVKSTPPKAELNGQDAAAFGSELENAIRIALEAHVGQKEKNGQPYILHPLRVMGRLQTEPERTVAVLHEVLDTPGWTAARLKERGISDFILAALDYLRKHDGDDYNTFIHRCNRHPIARRVRLADLEDDMDIRRLSDVTDEDRKQLATCLEVYEGMIVPLSGGPGINTPMWFAKKATEKAIERVTERERLLCPMDWPED